MLRLRDSQVELFDAVMPPEVKVLSRELAAVDALLDDDRFLAPFVARFSCSIGRPTVPVETYLRLMYLKHRHSLGYETLLKEVADSLSWRRFCRLGWLDPVPHPTTLLKLTQRFGTEIVEELNRETLKAAVEKKVLRSRRLRVDCTAMEADVRYPTDSGLCAHAVSRVGRAVAAVKAAGLGLRTKFRNHRRSASKVARKLSLGLGRPGSKETVLKYTGQLRDLAQSTLKQAQRVLDNARRRAPRPEGRGRAAVKKLAQEIERGERVVMQTRRRLAGEAVIADRVISLCDFDARPLRRGKPQRPNEFGYKVALGDTREGFVVAHQVHFGNPFDTDTLRPLLQQAKAVGMRVRTVFADRGFGNEAADAAIQAEAIPDKVIPRVGKAAPVEATRSWRRRYRWRAGSEGRISHLKRRYGLKRTRLKGYAGAQVWAGYGILAGNLDRIVALAG